MTGKVIDSGANRTLLVILPLAIAIAILFIAWPFFLGLFIIGLGWKLWQTHQWRKLSNQINPIFNQLVQTNKGCLTVLDLSAKTSLSAAQSQWYLQKKAEEFGAVCKLYEDKGIVYYFLTANALGSIFDDSEPDSEEIQLAPKSSPSYSETTSVVNHATYQEDYSSNIATQIEPKLTTENQETENYLNQPKIDNTSLETQSESNLKKELRLNSEVSFENAYSGLTQADLAKRLEVHSTTVGKRKNDPDFPIWSQSKDPDGMAWQYLEENKVFVPLELEK